MTQMSMGSNVQITATALRATLNYSVGAGVPDVDASGLLLRADGRVASDADFVFYNQPAHPSGSVRHLGKSAGVDALEVDLPLVPADVDRIVFAASCEPGTFGQVPDLRLVLGDRVTNAEIAGFAMTASTETAIVCGELYRRGVEWKFRAVGQGYASGLAGLASDFGIGVDGPPESPAPPAPAQPAPPVDTPPPPPMPPPPVVVPPSASLDLDAPIATLEPPASVAPPAPPAYAPPPPPHPPPVYAPPPPPMPPPPSAGTEPLALRHRERRPLTGPGGVPLARLVMAIGWQPAEAHKAIDLDASVIAFDAAGGELAIVWNRNMNEFVGALQHTGDSKEGSGQGDAERILVELNRLPEQVHSLVFTLTSFSGQTFTDLAYAYCRLVDGDSNAEVARFDLTDTQPSTAVLMSMLKRGGPGWWEVRTIGEFHDFRTPKKLVDAAARHATLP